MKQMHPFLNANISLEEYNDIITTEFEQTNSKFNDIFKDTNLRQQIMKAKIPPMNPLKFHLGEYCIVENITHNVNYDRGSSFKLSLDGQYKKYLEYSGSSLYWDGSVGRTIRASNTLKGVAVLKIDREKWKIKYCKMTYHGDHWDHQRACTTSLNIRREQWHIREEYAGKVAHKHIYADQLYPIGMTKDEFIAYQKLFKN